jgi:chemotaxis protein MotA
VKSNVLGLVVGIFIVAVAVFQTSDDHKVYFDLLSLLIVVGGTFSVSIMTNGLVQTFKLCLLFFRVVTTDKYDTINTTRQILDVSRKSFFGRLSFGEISKGSYHPFIMDGLKLLHNKFEPDKLRLIMTNMMVQRSENHDKMVEKIELIAKYPPAFGMAGTIIGLVAVLKQINSPENMANIGPSMAVALLTTLYGILLSNYFFQPIADNIRVSSQKDNQIRQIIADGVILISEGHDPVYVREALLSYLSPQERQKILSGNWEGLESESEVAA